MESQTYALPAPPERGAHSISIVRDARLHSNEKASTTPPRKRILLITADGEPGGGVTNVLQLCRALKRSGEWHVTLCSQVNSHLVIEAKAICDEVHKIDFFKSRFDPRVAWQLRTLVRKLSPDLIHTHGSRAALPAAYAVGRSGPPIVHTVHGFHFHQKSWPFRRLAIKAEQRIARIAKKTIFVCENDQKIADAENVSVMNRSNLIIHHGIHIEDLPQKVATGKPTIVMLGRLVHQKHPEMLIEIADRLRNEGIAFQFIGAGPLQAKLQKEVVRRNLQDVIAFLGSHSREEALHLAASADLAVLPSRWEGFPISLLELLGMGIPVIAAGVNGIPEAVTHGFNGLLVEKSIPEVYAQQIRRLIHDRNLYSFMSRNARDTVASKFNEIGMAAAHLSLYQKAIVSHSLPQPVMPVPSQILADHPHTASAHA